MAILGLLTVVIIFLTYSNTWLQILITCGEVDSVGHVGLALLVPAGHAQQVGGVLL